MAAIYMAAILDFRLEQFSYFWSTSHPVTSRQVSSQLFVCVEVLRPSQPNGIMLSAVSLPNHTFIGQA